MRTVGKRRQHPDGDQALLQALGHPLRQSVMQRYVQSGDTLAPSDFVDGQQKPVMNIAYHVRELQRLGVLELVRTEPSRGSLKHFYRATKFAKETPWVLEMLGLKGAG